ncbi:MAG: F0F1 ATP synthase subunit delta [Wenzhouxiangellaceae bacterium]|nr:F0F1 ATP synthase subunit delta [Wenzhouxiangellaceae bacterium]
MLAETTLARPYARAAFSLADQAGTVDSWSAALARASEAVESEPMQRVIGHPKVDEKRVLGLFDEVLGESADRAFRSFLTVLMHYRRLPILPEIAAQFETLRRASEHRLKVNVTSAVEMDADQLERLAERLREKFGTEIEMETGVDADLIGGLVVRAGDKVIDASVRGRLEQLGRQLVR